MIDLIVDSTCDLPIQIMEKYNIKVLPLRVSIYNTEYIDRVNIDIDEVYSVMRKGIVPKTSQVNPADMYKLFTELSNEGKDFIYLSFSSKLSGTYSLACNIISELREQFPQVKMEVIDSKGGSAGSGLIALQLAKLIEKELPFESIVNEGKEMVKNIEHIFSLTDLEWLVRGGRISKVAGAIGTALHISPILEVRDGEIVVIKKVRGEKKVLGTLINIVQEKIKEFPEQIVAISHADDLDRAMEIKEMLQEKLGVKEFIITRIGSVLGAHLGISGVGILFFNKRPTMYIE